MSESQYPLLDQIQFPSDLKKLSIGQLAPLSVELRHFIIDMLSTNSGHLGASLGVVELAIALHYVYNTPYDKLIWDVGHQAYAHKILTGRRNQFHSNRKYKGLSGFPRMSESEYDSFGVGHSSTSISAALGIATAAHLMGETDRNVVAVIGDGSLTGGLAFEGLNNAGSSKANVLVIVNDNNMSIDPNVGALNNYLLNITTSRTYNQLKTNVWNFMGLFGKKSSKPRRLMQKFGVAIKSALLKHSNLFESLNFRYFGPVDGHHVAHLVKILQDLKNIPGPKILHIITTKGKGYRFAEEDQTTFHAPGLFNKYTGEILKVVSDQPQPLKYPEIFGKTITELAGKNEKIVVITPAMISGSALKDMFETYPDRAFDVGIAEQHAVTFSAGLSVQGFLPFCIIYSSFMQRAFDQVIHDVALQHLHVVFCLDRAGLVGEDGPTHHGAYDMAYMRCIPDLIISAPMNEEELRNLMFTSQSKNYGPFSIRYPKCSGVMIDWKKPFKNLPIGKGRLLNDGNDAAILSIGHAGNFVVEAIHILSREGLSVAHADMRFLKPIDIDLLHQICKKHKLLVTVEDGTVNGGLGGAVAEFISEHGYAIHLERLGIPDNFIQHGTLQQLYHECGYDAVSIAQKVKSMVTPNVLFKAI